MNIKKCIKKKIISNKLLNVKDALRHTFKTQEERIFHKINETVKDGRTNGNIPLPSDCTLPPRFILEKILSAGYDISYEYWDSLNHWYLQFYINEKSDGSVFEVIGSQFKKEHHISSLDELYTLYESKLKMRHGIDGF